MSEKEKDIIKIITEALPNMSDFEKGYFLGVAESKRAEKERETKIKETVTEKAG